ncbi:MAG: hypothetical protein ACOCQI_01725 [Desulfosalsimonas sp.]
MPWAEGLIGTLVVAFIIYVWRSHDRRICSNEANIRKMSETIGALGSQHRGFKESVNARFKKGDEYFVQLDEQLRFLKESVGRVNTSVEQLSDINKRLSEQVQVLDERIYEQKT